MTESSPDLSESFDSPLPLGLTPSELLHILPRNGGSYEGGVGTRSEAIASGITRTATSPRSGYQCRLIEADVYEPHVPDLETGKSPGGDDVQQIWVELQVNDCIVSASWRALSEPEWVLCKAAAEEAFRLWCAVIGIRVSRQPVIELPPV